jgi:hypothetical protein
MDCAGPAVRPARGEPKITYFYSRRRTIKKAIVALARDAHDRLCLLATPSPRSGEAGKKYDTALLACKP